MDGRFREVGCPHFAMLVDIMFAEVGCPLFFAMLVDIAFGEVGSHFVQQVYLGVCGHYNLLLLCLPSLGWRINIHILSNLTWDSYSITFHRVQCKLL